MKTNVDSNEMNNVGLKNRCSFIPAIKPGSKANCLIGAQKRHQGHCECQSKIVPYFRNQVFSQMRASVEMNHRNDNLRFWKQKAASEVRICRNSNGVYENTSLNRALDSLDTNKALGAKDSRHQCTNQILEKAQKSFIELLRGKLLKSRFFSINELHKTKNVKVEIDQAVFSSQGIERISISIEKMTADTFLNLCNAEKHASRSIQYFIEASQPEKIQHVFNLINLIIPELITNPLGNYVLQVAAQRSSLVALKLEQYCKENINRLCSDEYASRVMQTLVEIRLSFRKCVLQWASENLKILLEALPSVFLLTAALIATQQPSELICVREKILSSCSKQFFQSRYFKRILMSFIDKCHFSDISSVCEVYRINQDFYLYLNDKFGAFILIAVIRRGFQLTTDLLFDSIREDIMGLYHTKFFKFVFYRLGKEAEFKGFYLTRCFQ